MSTLYHALFDSCRRWAGAPANWARRLSSGVGLRGLRLGVVLLLAAVIWLGTTRFGVPSAAPSQQRFRPQLVRGYIATRVGKDDPTGAAAKLAPRDIFLPDVRVFLRDLLNGTDGQPVTTDLSGRFTLRAERASRYQVCWKAPGFVDGCEAKIFSVANTYVFLSTLRIAVARRNDTTAVFGRVQMKDGSAPRHLAPLAATNAFAQVTLLDGGGNKLQQVYVNNFGDYMLPQTPVRQAITLRAQIEAGLNEQRILPEANLAGAPFHAINLTIGNTPPRIEPVVPGTAAGQRLKNARPGSTVRLTAQASDADGDPLQFKWQLAAGSGVLSAVTGAQVNWTVPTQPGRYSLNVTAFDGKGGYAQSPLSLRVDEAGIPFSGQVDATDGTLVSGATVEINGRTAVTGATGYFQIRVQDARRFVLNIRKPGYALVSRIYDDAVTGGRWTMTRATVTTIDPTRNNDVVNERTPRDCPGPAANRLNWRGFPQLLNPQWQDGKGNVIAAKRGEVPVPQPGGQQQNCGPGVRVRIAANSLQDQQGQPPAGNVQVALSTVDLRSPEQMPGDYTVRLPGGTTRVMESYGAGIIEITSGARRYNLKPGTTATMTIPIDPSQLAAGGSIPATIPILFYNERDGVWVQEGTANRSGNNYVAVVKHFSAINTDLVKTNQSCVEVISPALPASYKLETTIPLGGGAAPRVITSMIDNSSPSRHVLYNLPSNTNIVVVPIRLAADAGGAANTPIGTFVVNTGGPQNPTNPNLPVLTPQGYTACSTRVTLSELAIPPEPLSGEFLHGLYSFEAVDLTELTASDPALAATYDTATANYYAQIDPRGKRPTLNDFKTANGFPTGEIRGVFANSGDLGFGRDMHCVKKTGSDGLPDIACYVTNYGDINTPDDQDAIDAVNGANPVATVAMEYSRIESPLGNPTEFDDPDRVVKFYVYNGAGTALLRSANLDGLGARPIPQLCMVCHNGEYPGGAVPSGTPTFATRDDVKLGSRFLPFDLRLYTFAPAPHDKATQQAAFKQLNEDIVKNTPPDAAIADVITKMYPGGPAQDETFVVSGWNASADRQAMYRNVVAPTCRTCHVANVFPPLKFDQSSQLIDILGGAESKVCEDHIMPHAKRTHDIFWTSVGPHMPAQFQVFGDTFKTALNGWQGDKCGQFTGGGVTPPSIYSTTIQPLWEGPGSVSDCTGCHLGASPPANLNLTAAVSYANLVNVNAFQLGSMKRIKPSDVAFSYLVHKVEGTQGTVGGSGGKMPQGCSGASCFSAAQIQAIKDWINAGAPPP